MLTWFLSLTSLQEKYPPIIFYTIYRTGAPSKGFGSFKIRNRDSVSRQHGRSQMGTGQFNDCKACFNLTQPASLPMTSLCEICQIIILSYLLLLKYTGGLSVRITYLGNWWALSSFKNQQNCFFQVFLISIKIVWLKIFINHLL
jgi:hypothetical protein